MKDLLNKIHLADMRELIKKVDDNSIACIFTDIPYKLTQGGNPESSTFGWNETKKNDGKVFAHNDIEPEEYLKDFYRVLEDTGVIYLMTNNLHLAKIQLMMEEVGFTINNILVMVKNNAVVNKHYMKNCEFTIFARKGKYKPLYNDGLMSAMNVTMPRGDNKIHDTEKPIDYVRKLIDNSTRPDDIVADFFAGSGNVANAAIDLKLDFICCEIDEKFHKLACERVEKAKGNFGLFEGLA